MLKTSELLERFNNPQLIDQDINNLCQQKLAGIDVENLALSFNPGNLLKTLKSKPFVSRLSRDLGGAAVGAVPGALVGGMANNAYHFLTDESDPNATFTDRLLQGAKHFGRGALQGAIGGAVAGGIQRHTADSANLRSILKKINNHKGYIKDFGSEYAKNNKSYLRDLGSKARDIQGSNFMEGFKNTFNKDYNNYMTNPFTMGDFLR